MTDVRIGLLDELNRRLEELLGLLDGQELQDGARLSGSWMRCSAAFEAFRSADASALARGEGRPDAVRERMEAALRLQAVAASLAGRGRDLVADGLREMRQLRRKLREAAPDGRPAAGGACDVRG